jgi:uncharacterized protein with HEPN domain
MKNDKTYLLDMLLAAKKIQQFTNEMSKEDFEISELHQSAVIREIQVLGEAARLVSGETKTQYSEIQWRAISGMRNRVIHEYFRVSLDIVWQVVEEDIDKLIETLGDIISNDDVGENQ